MTEPKFRPITFAMAEERWPESTVRLDLDVPHLSTSSTATLATLGCRCAVLCHHAKLYIFKDLNAHDAQSARWNCNLKLWVRFSRNITSRPRRRVEEQMEPNGSTTFVYYMNDGGGEWVEYWRCTKRYWKAFTKLNENAIWTRYELVKTVPRFVLDDCKRNHIVAENPEIHLTEDGTFYVRCMRCSAPIVIHWTRRKEP